MSSAVTTQPLLAVELPASGQALTLVPRTLAALRAFAAAGVGLAVIADDLRPVPEGQARADAPTLAAFAAPAIARLGLAPAISTTHTEPFHLAKVVQTLDHASRGRAGWQVAVSTDGTDAAYFGRRAALDEHDAWAEAEDAIEVAERLWDSWEDDAEIRDEATGRFIDRDRVHHIDFEGRFFSVRGPSIVPRSPQGRPPIIVSATGPAALGVAARRADVIRVAPGLLAAAREAVERAGRAGLARILVDVPVASAAGVGDLVAALIAETGAEGVVLVFEETPDAAGWAAELARFAGPVGPHTLRDRLGLGRPLSRYARPGQAGTDHAGTDRVSTDEGTRP
jgi:alkanesulfonate monooxygenase SsuD/methylene tetrahydromethanopterin reductase-like flavin-dependent oxidoreductase (luciferase family)